MNHKHRAWHIVNNNRNKFRALANKTMHDALTAQIEPVLHHAKTIHDKKKLDALISDTPIKKALSKIYYKVGLHFGKAAYNGLKKAKGLKTKGDGDGEDDFDITFQDAVNDYIGSVGASLVKSMSKTTRDKLNDFLKEAEEQGWGTDKIAREMKLRFAEINLSRARMIAITETNRASSWATVTGADMTGIDYIKSWIQTPAASKVPREDHSDIDDVEKGEYFDVAGEQAMQPQDASLSPEESINCHCTVQLSAK